MTGRGTGVQADLWGRLPGRSPRIHPTTSVPPPPPPPRELDEGDLRWIESVGESIEVGYDPPRQLSLARSGWNVVLGRSETVHWVKAVWATSVTLACGRRRTQEEIQVTCLPTTCRQCNREVA